MLPRWTVYVYSHTLHTVENFVILGPKSVCRVSESLMYSTAHGLNVYILTFYARSRISPILPPKVCVGCQKAARVLYMCVFSHPVLFVNIADPTPKSVCLYTCARGHCVAVGCSVLQCVAVWCSVLPWVAVVAVCCNVLQCVAVRCRCCMCVVMFCNMLQ